MSTRHDKFIEQIEDDIQFTQMLVSRFNDGTSEDKQTILKRLGRTMTLLDGKVYIESKAPYIQFKSVKEKLIENPDWLVLTEANKESDMVTYEKIRTFWSE